MGLGRNGFSTVKKGNEKNTQNRCLRKLHYLGGMTHVAQRTRHEKAERILKRTGSLRRCTEDARDMHRQRKHGRCESEPCHRSRTATNDDCVLSMWHNVILINFLKGFAGHCCVTSDAVLRWSTGALAYWWHQRDETVKKETIRDSRKDHQVADSLVFFLLCSAIDCVASWKGYRLNTMTEHSKCGQLFGFALCCTLRQLWSFVEDLSQHKWTDALFGGEQKIQNKRWDD